MSRLLFVDGLRGIAASAVVIYHLCQRSPLADWTAEGGLGVIVFFVLSGLVISMVIGRQDISLGYVGRFAARRSLRLDPPYWVSIIVAIVLMVAAGYLGEAKALPTLATILAHLTYTQDLLGFVPLSEVYWTLCLEIQFYLFLLLLLWYQGSRFDWAFRYLWMSIYCLSLTEYTVTDYSIAGLCLPYWWAFALGSTLTWVRAGRMPAWMLGVMLTGMVPFALGKHSDGLLAGALTAGVLYLAITRNTLGTWLSGRVWQFLGRTSYSLYLIHPLVGWSAQSLMLRYADEWTALAVGLSASVVSAWMMYWVVERPAIRLSHLVRMTVSDLSPVPQEVSSTRR